MTAVGIAFGVLVWATLFAFGIGAVLQAYPETLTAMRLIGGGYLLYLGIRSLRAAMRTGGSNGVSARVRPMASLRTWLNTRG